MAMMGNCIEKVEGQENLKAYVCRIGSRNKFLCCEECKSVICQNAPEMGTEAFPAMVDTCNIENSNKPIDRKSTVGRVF